MSKFIVTKIIGSVPPTPVEPNKMFAVRVGEGFELYISDATGNFIHKHNGIGDKPINANDRIDSKLGLIVNGGGNLLTNYNFSWSTIEFSYQIPTGYPACFKYVGEYKTKISDEFIPLDPRAVYKLQINLRTKVVVGRQYIGFSFYDIDKNKIVSYNHMTMLNTRTTLTQPLNTGDTEMFVTDVSNWVDGQANSYRRSVSFFDHKNSLGATYEFYTRSLSLNMWDSNTGAFDIANNKVIFKKPYTGANRPIGTVVAQTEVGATYKYTFASGVFPVSNEWTEYIKLFGGVDKSGKNYGNQLPPGGAFSKLLFLSNYSQPAGSLAEIYYTGISMLPIPTKKLVPKGDGSNLFVNI